MEVGDRLEILEGQYKQLEAQNATILHQLEQLVQQTKESFAPPAPTPWNPAPSRPLSPSDKSNMSDSGHPALSKLKPATPDDFDGDRSKGRAFLSSCELYQKLAPGLFPDETTMVHWAMSFMKSGRASLWSQRVLRKQLEERRISFPTWYDFRTAFVSDFCPKNETQMALAKLETNGYFQGKRSVDDYIDEFRELVDQAGYREGLAIVVKFRRGLDRDIQDQIAQLVVGRPGDDRPEEWFQAAVSAEENRTANLLFHGPTRVSAPVQRTTENRFFAPPRFGTAPPTSWLKPQNQSHVRSPPAQNPVPMEIDANRNKKEAPDTCRRCGKPGHWARDCPQRFDIRLMTLEEKEEVVQAWSLEADIEDREVRSAAEEEEVGSGRQDFRSSSR
jgi:Retrotransposon gag protein/Zinc knuckle